MTIESWEEVALPVGAEEAAKGSWLDAAKHSLVKWQHLRGDKLKEHGLWKAKGEGVIRQDSWKSLRVDGDTCALCLKATADENPHCYFCPLAAVRDEVACDRGDSPWHAWARDNDPEPMIKDLEATVRMLEEKPQWPAV